MNAQSPILGRLKDNIEKVILGKSEAVRLAIITLLAQGHLLIEDVPGVGKTSLAHALAHSLNLTFKRIQFTNDILPSDITGVSIFNQKENRFEFNKGPLFANIVLADEINRSTPRTQSALLEAMNEKQVSVDNSTYPLDPPFMVIATQNPIDSHGAFPLPESQMDRFMMYISMGYPSEEDERRLLSTHTQGNKAGELDAVLTREEVVTLQSQVESVTVEPVLVDYILKIITATRTSQHLALGVSPRGGLIFQQAARACALLEGRAYCIPDDVKQLAVPVLAHRVLPQSSNGSHRHNFDESSAIIRDIVDSQEVPI